MFTTLVLVIHVIVCIAMILIILLQSGKGADIGAAFGGGSSQTVFGSSGATTFLSKVTIVAAVVFMTTSFVLTYFSGKSVARVDRSIMTETSVPKVPEGVPQGEGGAKEVPSAVPGNTGPTPDAGKAGDVKPDVPSPASSGAQEGGTAVPTAPKAGDATK